MSIYQFDPEDARRFAQEQGIRTQTKGDELHFRQCPYCKNTTDDKNTFAINLRTGQFKCLRASCQAQGNMITLAKHFDFSLGRDVDEYYKRQRNYKDMTRYPRPEVRTPAIVYLESRGISKAIAEQYAITTQKKDESVLAFPFFDDNGKMQFAKYRKMGFKKGDPGNKEWCEPNCKPILFGMDQCDMENDTLIMTEGQIDSLSVAEAGLPNAVSVPTGANGFTWVPYCWDFLGKFKTLIIFGDHENGHITLLGEMRQRFHGTVKHVRPEDYLDCKDANELLQKHGKQAVIDAVNHAVMVENPKIKDMADVQRKDMSQMEHMDTGLESLNKTLGGFYFGQLLILTGERGLGKSTLGSQFATFAIRQGYTVFHYSGELMDWYVQDWSDRQMAGPDHITRLISNLGYENYLVNADSIDRIHQWYKGKYYIYDNSITEEDEQETLLETISSAIKQYACRFLLIDNLMTAMEDDLRSDLYRQQSNFVRKLANMAKQYNVLIVLVVHPRKRQGYEFSNDDVAGSSNITNLADVVMRYSEPEPDENDPYPPDRILQITKNRLNGRTDFAGINLWFDTPSKRIAEDKKFSWELGWESEFELIDDLDDEIPF